MSVSSPGSATATRESLRCKYDVVARLTWPSSKSWRTTNETLGRPSKNCRQIGVADGGPPVLYTTYFGDCLFR
jgi:hypothetical protein